MGVLYLHLGSNAKAGFRKLEALRVAKISDDSYDCLRATSQVDLLEKNIKPRRGH